MSAAGSLQELATSWNTQPGQPAFDAACDLNSDSKVNVLDLVILANNWSK